MFPCQRRETLSDLWLCRSDRYSRPKNVIESLVRHRQWLEMARRGRICKKLPYSWKSDGGVIKYSRITWGELCPIIWQFCLQIHSFMAWSDPIAWAFSHMQLFQHGKQWLGVVVGSTEGPRLSWVNGLQAWGTKVISMVSSWSLWAVAGFHLE